MGEISTLVASGALIASSLGITGLARGEAVPCEFTADYIDPIVSGQDYVDILANCDFRSGVGAPENIGHRRVRLSSYVGMLATEIDADFTMDRTFLGDANADYRAEVIQIARVDNLFVDWQTDSNGHVLVTRLYNGQDVGISPSSLDLELQMPEVDIADGQDDDRCRTDPGSPEYSGCMYELPVNNGMEFPGLGADNQGELYSRMMAIAFAKANDKFCLTNYYLPEVMNPVLSDYGFNLPGYDSAANTPNAETSAAVAEILILGFVRLQIAQMFGIPVQHVLIRLNHGDVYNPGPSYSQEIARLGAEGNLGSLSDSDNADNWCLQDVQAPIDDVRAIVDAAMAPEGYDWATRSFVEGDPTLTYLPGREHYLESEYA